MLSHGEELQRAVEEDGSTITGRSQREEWEDDEDDTENGSEVLSVAGSARERVRMGVNIGRGVS